MAVATLALLVVVAAAVSRVFTAGIVLAVFVATSARVGIIASA
jgi:hypothetical protein